MAVLELNVDPVGVEKGSKRAKVALSGVKSEGKAVERQLKSTSSATSTLNSVMRGSGVRNFSLQMNQVAQQAAAGGGFLRALSIQLPDLLLGFGTLGIAVGALAPLMLSVGANFLGAGDSAKALDDSIDNLSDTVSAYAKSAGLASSSTQKLSQNFGTVSPALREVLGFLSDLDQEVATTALADSVGEITKAFGGLSRTKLVVPRIGQPMAEILDTMYSLRDEFDLTKEAATELVLGMEAIGNAEGADQQLQAASRLNQAFVDAFGSVAQIPEELRSVARAASDAATEAKKIEAIRQAEISYAQELLGTLNQEAEMKRLIQMYGSESVQVAEARAEAERRAFNELVESLGVSSQLKDELTDAWLAANSLSQTDLAGAIGSGANEAARLAENLGISYQTAVRIAALGPQGGASPQGGRGGDPTTQGGSIYDWQNREASAFLDSWKPPSVSIGSRGGGGSGGGGGGRSAVETLRAEYESLMSSLDDAFAAQMRLKDGQETLNEALAAGAISADEHGSALELLRQEYAATGIAALDLQSVADTMQSEFSNAFFGIIDGTKSAEDAFKDMARSIIKELYEVLVVQQLVGSFDAATGTGNGLVGMIMGGLTGGLAGGRAGGGAVQAGMVYDVGERGPEKFFAPANGVIIPNKDLNSDAGTNVVVNMNLSANGDESVKQIMAKAAPKIAETIKSQIINDRRRGGQMRSAF